MSGTVGPMSSVLVVDDDDAVRGAIVRVAKNAGFEAIEANNGQAALDQLEAHAVDVIVSDIDMPGMDGMSLLAEIARRAADVPVIMLTGNPSLDTAVKAVRHGAFEYLTKPFEPGELRAVLKRAAHLHKVAHLRRQALAISGLPGGRADELDHLDDAYDQVLDQLWMAYQPIVRAKDGSVFAYETLLRSPVKALPHPGAVLHAAEFLGRLPELGRAVRAKAPVPMKEVPKATLFINLHTDDLLDETLYESDTPLGRLSERVVLEITERADLGSVRDLPARIDRLRAMGYVIAIDDLGSGYAGLASFVSLHPEYVKLDMSLVRGVDGDPLRASLVSSMVNVCRELEIGIIAEGVETASERDKLVELGVDLLQGYFIARPDRPFPSVNW